ncbi:MAG: hypothetical protein ACJAVI_003725 [Candidatus Azotimanducaceae bacterium]
MFFGSYAGGKRAAIVYSLIETCKACGVDPFEYLDDVFGRLADHPDQRREELLPYSWKPAQQHLRVRQGRGVQRMLTSKDI